MLAPRDRGVGAPDEGGLGLARSRSAGSRSRAVVRPLGRWSPPQRGAERSLRLDVRVPTWRARGRDHRHGGGRAGIRRGLHYARIGVRDRGGGGDHALGAVELVAERARARRLGRDVLLNLRGSLACRLRPNLLRAAAGAKQGGGEQEPWCREAHLALIRRVHGLLSLSASAGTPVAVPDPAAAMPSASLPGSAPWPGPPLPASPPPFPWPLPASAMPFAIFSLLAWSFSLSAMTLSSARSTVPGAPVSTRRPSPRYCCAGRGGGTTAPPPPAPTPPTPVVPGATAAGGGGGLSSGSVSAATSYLGIASTSFLFTPLATMPPSGLTSTRSKWSATVLAPRPRKPPLAITSFWIFPLWASTTASLTLPSGLPSAPWTERPIMSAALMASPAVAGARGVATAGGVAVGAVGVGVAPGPASWATAALAKSATAETAPSSS